MSSAPIVVQALTFGFVSSLVVVALKLIFAAYSRKVKK